MAEKIINNSVRNIAIIAHVDHGKTTLVDAMFKQSGLFRENQAVEDRLMDSMDLERERGITIAAKNCAVNWKGTKINIIDTPGHADFGGEVERALFMADGVILLVDASEGPLPQTRFVLNKALKAGLHIIVVINKIDRPDARTAEVLDEIYELLIDLEAEDDQLEFPLFYAIGRDGIAKKTLEEKGENIHCLLDAVVDCLPGPECEPDGPFKMLVSDLDYSDYLGRLAVGKILSGSVKTNDALVRIDESGSPRPMKTATLQAYDGMGLSKVESAGAGDIVILSGMDEVYIGDTICDREHPEPLPRITVDEPTVSMRFRQNDSPLAGKEGEHVQPGKIRDRLYKETLRNVAVQIEETDERDCFLVKGRGEFQLAILIETMRREGFELTVGRPHVIYKHDEHGKRLEPIEHLIVNCEDAFTGTVMDKLSRRKGRMLEMKPQGHGRVRMVFSVPSRALIGYRDEFLTDTRGTGTLNSRIEGYEEYRGDFPTRHTGSIIADRPGNAVAYALAGLEARGRIMVVPGDPVYEGMIIGENSREEDMVANPTKQKKLTNMRASGKDDNVNLTPVTPLTLEKALQFIREDEMLEVTPKSLRLRKTYLSYNERKMRQKK